MHKQPLPRESYLNSTNIGWIVNDVQCRSLIVRSQWLSWFQVINCQKTLESPFEGVFCLRHLTSMSATISATMSPRCHLDALWGLRDADRMDIQKYDQRTYERTYEGRCSRCLCIYNYNVLLNRANKSIQFLHSDFTWLCTQLRLDQIELGLGPRHEHVHHVHEW